MKFKVYAGNVCCGTLTVFSSGWHSFVSCWGVYSEGYGINQTVKQYKNKRFVRV